jgi:uncharacterized caspase-like protein
MLPSDSPTSSPAPPVRLFALLVGIDAYQNVRPLRGPVADVRSVEAYLRAQPEFAPDLRVLTDADASKAAVIDGFQTHLKRAGAGDTVLFYFSGHGAQEAADPALWPTETDGRLECLVCHDGGATQPWEFLLADKELRCLLADVAATGAHVVTVADCCHSGDNTRNLDWLEASLAGQDVRERRLTQSAPQRPYEGFFFHDRLSADDLKAQGIETALPQAAHVQLAACEADEAAVEVNGEGIFTKNLLQVLRASGGVVSYGSLHNRVRQAMRFGYEQRPRIYAVGEAAAAPRTLETLFLNRPGTADGAPAEASFNPKTGWLLDVGAIHGVGQTTGTLELLDPETKTSISAQIATIGPDYTVLILPDGVAVSPEKTYRATVPGLMTRRLRVHFDNQTGAPADLTALLTALDAKAGACFVPEETEGNADYALRVRNGLYYLTRPGDPFRPLVQPVVASEPTALNDLANDLRHLARWQYLRDLQNPEAGAPRLKLEVEPVGGAAVLLTEAQSPAVTLTVVEQDGKLRATADLRLSNPTDQPVYCTALYLSRDFGSAAGALLDPNTRLEPGQTLHLGAKSRKSLTGRLDRVTLGLEDVVLDYNWPEVTEYVQLLVTTDPLTEQTLAFLELDALPSPPARKDTLADAATRGALETDEDETEPFPAWWTQRVALRLPNPHYNVVDPADLAQRLQPAPDGQPATLAADVLADFTLGLFYEVVSGAGGKPELALKPELTQLRGLWSDLTQAVTNTVANRMRQRTYEQNLIRYPDRVRIVAQGDSWFQYPFLLRDVVDYLGGVYNVCSLAAAGTSLEDFLDTPTFLTTIAQVKPAFFLLSGGGDALFGEAFPTYLRDAPDSTQVGADRYLAPTLAAALDGLQTLQRRIFRQVALGYPDVRVLVHGYDYAWPLTDPDKRGFLGRCLTDRSISDPADQEAVVRAVVDGFNERLVAAAGEFANVTYLDLRNTLRRTDRREEYWYDEWHPNDKGFLSVSSRFAQRIEALRKGGAGEEAAPAVR